MPAPDFKPNTVRHTTPVEQLLNELQSTPQGLSSAEAARRLAHYGPNELKESDPVRPLQIFVAQFKSLIVWILIVAGAISGLLGEMIDAIAIIGIVLLNGAIGFYQEFNAEKSIAALRRMTAPHAKARRDGGLVDLAASQIVVGDVLELEAGDLVPADARLLRATSLKCVESALTGESEAVQKKALTLAHENIPLGDRENMLFMGTSVVAGTAQALVVATGMHTEIGKIATLISQAGLDQSTPLQQKLASVGRTLVWLSLGIVVLLFILGLLRGHPVLELVMTSVSLAVAAVPEGLPAVVTVALALGVMRMSRRRALIRKLASVETLGSTSVICTDKTGTLTVGQMTVRELFVAGRSFRVTGEGYAPEGHILLDDKAPDLGARQDLALLLNCCVASNNAHLVQEEGQWKVLGDPTEGALLAAAAKLDITLDKLDHQWPRLFEIPFDSDRKRRTVVRRMPEGVGRAVVNGAPDVLLRLCSHIHTAQGVRPLTDPDRQAITAANSDMADRALRVLASAFRDIDSSDVATQSPDAIERNLVFVGLTGMFDPPRTEAKVAIARCRSAGIRVVMITGDHPHTAMAIARDLGIAAPDEEVIPGMELDTISDAELRRRVAKTAVYARVTAEHKLRIIRAWKAENAVVAMTGDGVNDAPAIKGADIGVAMGRSGTEVTKQASDIIITDDNFASIVAAVEEGRGIYDNIRKTLQYLLAGNAGELLLMTLCVIVGLPTPLLPLHLLWINLVTDGLPALCLATDPIDSDVMTRRPRPRAESIMNRSFLQGLLLTGTLTAAIAFIVFYYGLKNESLEMARTHAFAALVFAELLRAFGARSETKPVWRIPLRTNVKLFVIVLLSFGFQVLTHYSDTLSRLFKTSIISVHDCLLLIALSLVPLAVLELRKLLPAANRSNSAGGKPITL